MFQEMCYLGSMRNIGKPSARRFVTQMLLIALLPLALAQAQERRIPTIAVMPLSGPGLDAAASQAITDGLADELIKTGKVRVMERSQMESILKEQGFQQSGACDGSECAVQVGKLLSIEQMVVGSVGKLGSSFSIMVRTVDVKTGEVMATSRKVQRGEIDEVVVSVLPTLAQELTVGKTSASTEVAAAVSPAPSAAKAVAPLPVTSSALAPSPLAPKPDATMTATPAPKPQSDAASKKPSGSSWGWWVAGGVALAGGAAAAVLLSGSKSSSAAVANGGGTTGSPSNETGWTSKVVW